jgi:hypothetical protein
MAVGLGSVKLEIDNETKEAVGEFGLVLQDLARELKRYNDAHEQEWISVIRADGAEVSGPRHEVQRILSDYAGTYTWQTNEEPAPQAFTVPAGPLELRSHPRSGMATHKCPSGHKRCPVCTPVGQ